MQLAAMPDASMIGAVRNVLVEANGVRDFAPSRSNMAGRFIT